MSQHRVLLVEDDHGIAEIEGMYLQREGYAVLTLHDGHAVLDQARLFQPHIIILDRLLPGRDGLSLCRELRHASSAPIIMVTALREEQDRLDGFAAGADDYLCKPFNPPELVARVKAVLRRSLGDANGHSQDILILHEKDFNLQAGPARVQLTRSEYRILALLMAHAGQVIDREQILQACFSEKSSSIFDRAVDNHVLNLRKKIAGLLPQSQVIHSLYGMGYKYEPVLGEVISRG